MAEDDQKHGAVHDFEQHELMARDYAIAQIKSIASDVSAAGANDSELEELDSLVTAVLKGENPENAVKRAKEIFASKNMYH